MGCLKLTYSKDYSGYTPSSFLYKIRSKEHTVRSQNFTGGYIFGFWGLEKDNEIYGEANEYDGGSRIYNPRLGRWLSIDLLMAKYPYLTPYNSVANSPLCFVDHDGKKIIPASNLSEADRVKVTATLKLVNEHNNPLYVYLDELKFHSGLRKYLSKGEEGYNDDEAFEVIIEVGINKDIPNNNNNDNIGIGRTFSEKSKEEGSADFGDVGYAGVGTDGSATFLKDKNAPPSLDNLYKEKVSNENKDADNSTIVLAPRDNGKAHFLVKINDNVSDAGATTSHEFGHVQGFIQNPLNTFFFGNVLKDTKDGHADGYMSGKKANDAATDYKNHTNSEEK